MAQSHTFHNIQVNHIMCKHSGLADYLGRPPNLSKLDCEKCGEEYAIFVIIRCHKFCSQNIVRKRADLNKSHLTI